MAGPGASADSSGAAVWIDGAQCLASPEDPSFHPLPGKPQTTWVLEWGWGQAEPWWGITEGLGRGSHLHTQLGTLLLLPIDLGHSLQGLQGEVQVPQGGVPEGRLYEEPVGGVWGWHEFSLS